MIKLTLMSVLLHAIVTIQLGSSLPTADKANESKIKRMEATYVKEVKLSVPPVAMVRPAAPPPAAPTAAKNKAKKIKPPQEKASEPEDAASEVEVAKAASEVSEVPKAETKVAEATPPPAPASTPSAPDGPAFEWPKATKVSFRIDGYLLGKITGNATIEWVRKDDRYQIFFDARAGLVFSAQGSSEGNITPEGLYPTRNEARGSAPFKEIPNRSIVFDRDEITFPNGDKVARPEDVQDLASMAIQLVYKFTLNPKLLTPGNTLNVKIATAKQLENIALDVVGEETIDTPMGPIKAFHVKPRKAVETGTPFPLLDIWFAPNLQYLPIRLFAERTEGPRQRQFRFDFQMERPPQQVGAKE